MGKLREDQLRQALKLYFIMGSGNCTKPPAHVLREAIAGGITMFQFREKGDGALTGDAKRALAEQLQHLCRKSGIPFIVNDDVDLALAIDADGVHIGQDDEPVEEVRKRIGDKILGVSVHNGEEAKEALEKGADYFGVGPIFPTETKKDAEPVQGVGIIKKLREKGFAIPIVGIGGINRENAAQVIAAGADGISVISAICMAENIKDATVMLKKIVS